MRLVKIVMVLATAVTLLGCQVNRVVIKPTGHINNPAPVYGYYKRYPHRHRYDDELGLYIFLESPDTYYHNNYYYRWSVQFERWERSHQPRGGWRKIHKSKVPPKLVKRRLKHNKRINKRAAPAKHAPAYGYYKRYPHRHRYDNDLGLYIFLESPYTYYQNDHYIRWSVKLNRWERAREPYGNWRQIHEREVPTKLVKQRGKNSKRHNGQDKIAIKKGHKKEPRNNRRGYREDCNENGKGRGRSPNRCRD